MEKINTKLKCLLENKEYDQLLNLIEILKKNEYPESITNFYLNKIPKNFNQIELSNEDLKYNRESEFNLDPINKLGCISQVPFISIIIVTYNSGNDLCELLPTLKEQTYTNWEIIIVDNGEDNTKEICSKFLNKFKYVKCDNVGFAEGNNIGLENSSGELILLLNPDTKLDKNAIKKLVFNLRLDASAAAASPIIYFYDQFQKINLRSEGENFKANFSSLIEKIPYKKYFIREGTLDNQNIINSVNGLISIDISIPMNYKEIEIEITKNDDNKKDFYISADFDSNNSSIIISQKIVSYQNTIFKLRLNKIHHSSSRILINNAGSGFREDGQIYDIGFGEIEKQEYENKSYIKAFCGCCVLLRRELFIKRKIFISEFFAYFEDSELSHWINENEMRILYVPSAKIYHKHSESTQENSITWKTLVSRSKKIYDFIVNSDEKSFFEKIPSEYCDISSNLNKKLTQLDFSLNNKTKSMLINKKELTIGIYNSYWNTFGGGEKHALDFAFIFLNKGYKVYLISETNFDKEKLSDYFGLNLSNAEKLIIGSVNPLLTSRFDVFINSTFKSNLISLARKSFYIVSFPHSSISNECLNSYTFLYNSDFTKFWSQKLWAKHQSKTIYPILGFKSKDYIMNLQNKKPKDKFILNIGRFNLEGHCKNQHTVAKIFKKLLSEGKISNQWQLVFIGSVDYKSNSSLEHLDLTKANSNEKNTKFFINAPREIVDSFYRDSAIYVHATGLGINEEINPEKCEHFGISTFEALMNGCINVVYGKGGPSMQVKDIKDSFTFINEKELEEKIITAVELFESQDKNIYNVKDEISKKAQEILSINFERINEIL